MPAATTDSQIIEKPVASPFLIGLMALGSSLSVASLYYSQPLLPLFTREFGISQTQAGFMVTMTQLGYITGLILLVPLGDRLERRSLLSAMTAISACGLFAMSLAPNFGILVMLNAIVGVTSVTAQMFVALAAYVADPARRGRTVSTVMTGLVIGVLMARLFSGTIAEFGGWRLVYALAGLVLGTYSAICFWKLPRVSATSSGNYFSLLASIVGLVRTEPILRRRAAMAGLASSSMAMFWTTIAFMLQQYYGYGEAVIGSFGLIGVAGATGAQVAGRIADAGWARLSTAIFIAIASSSWLLLYYGQYSLAALIIGVLLVDFGVSAAHISNQSEIYRLDASARSRLTTAYMSSNFLGQAMGSALGATFYGTIGWSGIALIGATAPAIALIVWARGEAQWPLHTLRRTETTEK